ncbi:uncharacterized protein LOC141594059 [Silene latifolia]|uniref:uncharacterized protein LOC141594059 n=1 Tax=Silene latifolia TaxID=37657 RepID=UPI003D775B56
MGEVRDGESKKHKKRKHREVEISVGEDGDEKNDIEGLSSNGVSEDVVDVDANVSGDSRPGKKKKKEKGSLNKVEDSSGTSGEERDGKSLDVDDERKSSGVMGSEVGVITEEVKLKKDKKEKKKKSKPGSESVGVDVVGHAGTVEKQVGDEGGEEVDSVTKKKRKEKGHGVSEKEDPTKDNIQSKKKDVLEVTEVVEHAEGHKKKKKKKKKKEEERDLGSGNVLTNSEEGEEAIERAGLAEDPIGTAEEVESVKKNEKRTKKKDGFGEASVNDEGIKDGVSKKRKKKSVAIHSDKNKDKNTDVGVSVTNDGEGSKDGAIKKRKKKSVSINSEENTDGGASLTSGRTELSEGSEKSNLSKKSRKVKFSDSVEVFTLTDNSSEGDVTRDVGGNSGKGGEKADDGNKKNSEDGLVQGKRFTKEEDEILRNAVLQYIEDHRLGEDGVQMIMKCGKHRAKIKDCWGEIGQSLPWRNKQAIYSRAHILFERSENHKWTKEELEEVRQYYEKHGPKWRQLADEIGRNRIHVKDAFRQVRLPNKKTGQWSQEEYQTLFDLVNKDLRIRAKMERKSKHGMLRDNIGWEAISQLLETRTDPLCCHKWYNQLSSVLVSSGKWADTDDYRMLMALVDLDATCEEEVDWDNVLEHRPGDVCRKRWLEMVRHIGEYGTKSFSQKVEILSQRYCPDVLDARVAYESKPFVDC